MNYSGKFDAKLSADGSGLQTDGHGHGHVETITHHATHAPAGAIIVPDAQLLFNGDFKRSGVDLVLSRDDHELVLHDYFKGEKRAALASPDGAHLTGDIVNALTGHTEYAQADGSASAGKVIGHVTKLAGTATAVRNGVSVILHQGDNVEKGDVVASGSDSTLGITFIDGTVFGLSSNARMVLNEMVYDPNGSDNSSLMSLVAGTISFVAGETAKHGDMKVDTPVATMGIRGTAVLVEIDFDVPGTGGAPDAKFQVLVEPDGTTGSYILFDKNTLTPIATVNQAGQQINISQGQVSITNAPLPPDVQKLITDVFSLKFTDSNPKTFDHFTDNSITPQSLQPFILANGTSATPVIINVNTTQDTATQGKSGSTPSIQHIAEAPQAAIVDAHGNPTTGFFTTERAGKTGDATDLDTVSGQVNFADINAGDTPTVSAKFTSFTYQNAAHQNVTATLNALQLADIAAVEAKLLVVPAAGNSNFGSATWTYSVADKAFDFLAAGETLTLTYTATVDNNYAPSDQTTPLSFTITITGTNDVPVITTGPQFISFLGGTSVPGGNLTTTDATSGALAFTDVDLTDTHTVATKLVNATLAGGALTLNETGLDALAPKPMAVFEQALSATVAGDSTGTGSGTINWKLADLSVYLADFIPKGETLTLTYAVTVTDSQGATSTQDVTVAITGTDSPAVVWIATTTPGAPSGGLWSDASNWETGTVPTATDDAIIITNQLIGLTPSYPVTINSDVKAVAKTVTLNDFSDLGDAHPQLIDNGTLTIGGTFSLSVDSIVDNAGTISVGGAMEVLDSSVLQNSALITLELGGDFKDQSSITNSGAIEIGGGTLNVQVGIANGGGTITVDDTGRLTVSTATVTSGTLTNNGEIDLTGIGVLKSGILGNSGQIKVSGSGNALDGEVVTNSSGIEVLGLGALTLDQLTTFLNAGGTITVYGLGEATLNGATVTGGSITNDVGGELDLTGNGILKNGSLGNSGQINVSATGNELYDEIVAVNYALEVLADGALLIDQGTTIANTGGSITIDGLAEATLNGATVTGGAVTNEVSGELNLTGNGILKNGSLANSGQIDFSGAGNELYGETVTVNYALEVLAGGALLIDHGTTVANAGGAITLDGLAKAMLNGATVTGGAFTNDVSGELDLTGNGILKNGSLGNSGQINISGTGNELYGETVTASYALVVLAGGALLVDQGTTIANAGGGITVDDTGQLTLNGATITGGTLSVSGTLDSSGPSAITDVAITITDTGLVESTGGVLTIDPIAGPTLINHGFLEANGGELDITNEPVTNTGTLQAIDDSTLRLTSLTVVEGGGTVMVASGATLDLVSATISGGTVTDHGTIDVSGSSTITGALDLAGGQVTVEDNATLTLGSALAIGANAVTLAGSNAILDDSAGLSLAGGTIGGSGDLAADTNLNGYGTVSIPLDSADQVTASAGTLEFTKVVDGTAATSFEIAAATGSVLKFDAAVGTIAVNPTVTFEGSDNGVGVLDLTAISLTSFHGIIAGFDEGEAINVHNAASASLDNTGQVLTVFDSSGNSLGAIDLATSYAGDTFNVSNGAITVDDLRVTLDHTTATEGTAINVTAVSDDGASLTSGVTYSWQTLDGNGHWNQVGSNSSYSPTETDEGQSLRLVTTCAEDAYGSESTTVNLGTVAESRTETATIVLAGLTAGNAIEGQQITAMVTDADAPASGITYTFEISSDGAHWTTVQSGSGASYTPSQTNDGSQLEVDVSFTDTHGNHETGTASAGTVMDAAPVITSTSESASSGLGVNLVTNGGFESGDFSGWILSGNTGFTLVSSSDPRSGAYDAWLGPVGSDGHLTQNISTVAGQSYELDFWLANDGGVQNDFSVSWNGTTLSPQLINFGSQPYTEYQYDVVGAASSSALEFTFRQDPAYLHLDDVSVTSNDVADGTIGFTDSNNTEIASFTPAAQGYVGTFSLGTLNEANGTGSVDWHFSASSSELQQLLNPTAGHPITQIYDVAIGDGHSAGTVLQQVGLTFGSSANDTFVFAPGVGQEMLFNFSQQSGNADQIELDHFGISNFSQLNIQAVDGNHDTLINLGHNDSLLVVGVSAAHLHASDFILHA